MGVDNQNSYPHTCVMFDDYFERGGNAFDTARIYGHREELLGKWVANRGVRDQVVIITKGAHTPGCYPGRIEPELLTSLEQLKTDCVDVYLLHRDNPSVPVGEFIDALDEQKRAGRIRCIGVSNWTFERVDEANAYAEANDRAHIDVVSNQFSLARMCEPSWPGCLSASDAESRAWLKKTQTPLLAWSSQANGFLTGRADPNDRSDANLVRCWHAEDNFERLDRMRELAGRRNVEPPQLAVAYVLAQPFPTYALIGPRTLAETRTTWPALDIDLSSAELAWLNLEKKVSG
jgi:aryl-alcohol dehydrogenase-like predicted oxidoreductase